MSVEIKGRQLRIRVRQPKGFSKYRTQDVGSKGKLMRLAAYSKKTGWVTQAWRINLKDFNSIDKIMKTISSLRIPKKPKFEAISLAKKYFKLRKTSVWNSHSHRWSVRMKYTTKNSGHKHRIDINRKKALKSKSINHSHNLL